MDRGRFETFNLGPFRGHSALSGLSADRPGQPGDAAQKALGPEGSGISCLRVTRGRNLERPPPSDFQGVLCRGARSSAGQHWERSSSTNPPGRGFGSAQPLPARRGLSHQQHGPNSSSDSHPAGPSCRPLHQGKTPCSLSETPKSPVLSFPGRLLRTVSASLPRMVRSWWLVTRWRGARPAQSPGGSSCGPC